MLRCPEDPLRLRLAAMASCGADIRPRLRAMLVQQALAALPAHRAIELNAETAALCEATAQAVRRRAGWLYLAPCPAPLSVLLPRGLWQAAVLCLLRDAQPRGRVVLSLRGGDNGAWAAFRCLPPQGSAALPLLHHTAWLGGGICVENRSLYGFSTGLFLPTAPTVPLREPPAVADLLADRYSPVQVFLDGFTV